jgi:hypothetical protein
MLPSELWRLCHISNANIVMAGKYGWGKLWSSKRFSLLFLCLFYSIVFSSFQYRIKVDLRKMYFNKRNKCNWFVSLWTKTYARKSRGFLLSQLGRLVFGLVSNSDLNAQCCYFKGSHSLHARYAGCALIQGVLSYRVCCHRECAPIRCAVVQDVLSYRVCSHSGCAVIQSVLSFRVCSQCSVHVSRGAIYCWTTLCSGPWQAKNGIATFKCSDRLLPYFDHIMISV